jgi:hypothetical protein
MIVEENKNAALQEPESESEHCCSAKKMKWQRHMKMISSCT